MSCWIGSIDMAHQRNHDERRAVVVVAHPDDETLWVGGTIMMHPQWNWRVVSLCRGDDPDRRPRFFDAMTRLGVQGSIYHMDDGLQQEPLPDGRVQETVRAALESAGFDLIVTHSPFGEYTRHLRHEEVGRAVLRLWKVQKLVAKELWMFAYTDTGRKHYPTAIKAADLVISIPEDIWRKKLDVIQEIYGFAPNSWEALTTPRTEAFWCFDNPGKALAWQGGYASRPSHGVNRPGIEKEGPR